MVVEKRGKRMSKYRRSRAAAAAAGARTRWPCAPAARARTPTRPRWRASRPPTATRGKTPTWTSAEDGDTTFTSIHPSECIDCAAFVRHGAVRSLTIRAYDWPINTWLKFTRCILNTTKQFDTNWRIISNYN